MNLGIIAPGPADGTSFYRAFGPLSYLSRDAGVRLITADEWDWTNILQCDAMFLQRPFSDAHAMVAKTCRVVHVPLWVDFDDLYEQFPPWLPIARNTYGQESSKANMRGCIECADAITVSTEALRCISDRAEVIPNAANTYLWSLVPPPGDRCKIISWRGCHGHNGDLEPMIPALERVKSRYPDWGFHFLGYPHHRCYDLGAVRPYSDIFGYMNSFAELHSSIHIVPLADCLFNECKSNVAWLEATAVGALVVAPDLKEWVRPGIMNYCVGDPCSFGTVLEAAIRLSDKAQLMAVEASRRFIHDNLRLSVVNERRIEILKRFKK